MEALEAYHDSADGVPLHTLCWGPPSGAPVLLLHGAGQTAWSWRATAVTLAQAGHRATALDLRGHGDSGWARPGHYRIEDFLGDITQVADSRPSIIVGASLGGMVGLLAAVEERVATRALVLVDITPRWEPKGVERIVAFMRAHPTGFASLAEAADTIANYLPHRDRRDDHENLHKVLRQHDDGRYYWHWDPNMVAETAAAADAMQPAFMDAARRLDIPTLLVSGSMSDIVSQHTIEEFLALVPHAEHAEVDRARHMVAGDNNDAFADAILGFLASRRLAA